VEDCSYLDEVEGTKDLSIILLPPFSLLSGLSDGQIPPEAEG
jgi:hypothetical protein